MAYTVVSRYRCNWCDKAEDLLYETGIDYNKYHIEEHMWIRTLLLKSDLTTVPQVFDHNGLLIGGYEELAQHINNLDIYQ